MAAPVVLEEVGAWLDVVNVRFLKLEDHEERELIASVQLLSQVKKAEITRNMLRIDPDLGSATGDIAVAALDMLYARIILRVKQYRTAPALHLVKS